MSEHHISMTDLSGDGKKRLSEEQLMAYLDGKLSDAEQHEVELWLSAEGNMESDAIEGLRQLKPTETVESVNKLNHKLHTAIGQAGRKKRRHIKTDQFTWIAVVIVLFLVIVAYIVIRKAM